jgi:hypothetical protein
MAGARQELPRPPAACQERPRTLKEIHTARPGHAGQGCALPCS